MELSDGGEPKLAPPYLNGADGNEMEKSVTKLLTKEQILKVKDAETREVHVPEWGGTVRVKAMTGEERDRFEASIVTTRGKNVQRNLANIRAKLVACTVVDEADKLVFSFEDVAALGQKNAKALDRVYSAAAELSGISDSDVEEMAKNSEPGLNGASTSG